MKKYLLLTVIGLVSTSLQTMETDPRRMEQLRNERAQFEQKERKLADFENFLRNEWHTIPQLAHRAWAGFNGNDGIDILAARALSKAKEWKIDLEKVKEIFSDVLFDIMIMQKYGVEKGTFQFANWKELELKRQEEDKVAFQQAGQNYRGSAAVFYTNLLFNTLTSGR